MGFDKEQALREEFRTLQKIKESNLNKYLRTRGFDQAFQKLITKNKTKAAEIAQLTENLAKHMKANKLHEEVLSTSFQTRPENVLKIGVLGNSKSRRDEWVETMALSSTDDALYYLKRTYEKTLRGATTGAFTYESNSMDYFGEQQVVTLDAAGAGTTYTVDISVTNPLPMVPRQIRIMVGGALVALDFNGDGYITNNTGSTLLDVTTASDNFADYTAGIIKLKFLVAPNLPITMLYNWNSELTGNYAGFGTVTLESVKTRFNARPYPLGYKFSAMTEILIDTLYQEDAEDLLIKGCADEMAKGKDLKSIRFLKAVARQNGAPYVFDADGGKIWGENAYERWAQRVTQKISEISGEMRSRIKRGAVNVILGGTKAVAYLTLHKQWKEAENGNENWGIYKAGTLMGIPVYWTPDDAADGLLDTDELLLLYKNPTDRLDMGVVIGTLTDFSASLRYPSASTEGNLFTVEDIREVQTGVGKEFCKLLKIINTN